MVNAEQFQDNLFAGIVYKLSSMAAGESKGVLTALEQHSLRGVVEVARLSSPRCFFWSVDAGSECEVPPSNHASRVAGSRVTPLDMVKDPGADSFAHTLQSSG